VYPVKLYLEPSPPQHIPLYLITPQKRRSILRGKRFVEEVLDTGKRDDPLRYAIPRIPKKVGSGTSIDFTYINTEARETGMLNIRKGLATIQKNIEQYIPGVKVNFLEEQLKIQISKGGTVVKIEVNQGIRGLKNNLNELILYERAQEDFDAFCSIQGVPLANYMYRFRQATSKGSF